MSKIPNIYLSLPEIREIFVILFLAVLTVAQYLPRMFISRVVSYLGDVICYIDK